MPRWYLIIYTAFVAVLIPVYVSTYPLSNFLWFSNICLILGLWAAWTRQSLPASVALVAVGLVEMGWIIDFAGGLLLGGSPPFGTVIYMFDPTIPLLVRGLSLYHLFLPFALFWMVWRFGFHPHALRWCIGLGWTHLVIVRLLTDPALNINWVFHPPGAGDISSRSSALWFGLLLLGLALIWTLTFFICRVLLSNLQARPLSVSRQR